MLHIVMLVEALMQASLIKNTKIKKNQHKWYSRF